ncbi:hypothetical protein OP10G_1488 [Fimbriimonas ginsengisoli Gsoil 348]|uniref:Uncharacterized protein n=1 Tax=Fimbriimonas ginsengisoli Gsoil 348 TaxID=661478 RepID=A0A068NN15_FIMGI|nr:hypothetical protein OP10G_1488 [Fimbriimonas ginsengisoli Gsoil 348]
MGKERRLEPACAVRALARDGGRLKSNATCELKLALRGVRDF